MSVYYAPEKLGLTVVGEVEWEEPCWSFDTTVVWFKDGTFYWASDSGCSCPSPFESYQTLEQLEQGTFADVISYLLTVKAEKESWSHREDGTDIYGAAAVVELVSKIQKVQRDSTPIIKGV